MKLQTLRRRFVSTHVLRPRCWVARMCFGMFLSAIVMPSSARADQGMFSSAEDLQVPAPLPTHDHLIALATPVQMAAAVTTGPEWLTSPLHLRPSGLPALYVILAGLQGYDTYSTLAAQKRGAVEINPVFGGALGHPAALIALKGATTVGSVYVAEYLWRHHRRTAAIIQMAVTNGMMAAIAIHNASVIRAQR